MKNPTKRDILVLSVIAVAFLAMGFGISRCTQKASLEKPGIDVSRFEKTIDSILFSRKKDSVMLNYYYGVIDSLTKKLNDKNQHAHETKQIKNFTSSSRIVWKDSVARAEGLR